MFLGRHSGLMLMFILCFPSPAHNFEPNNLRLLFQLNYNSIYFETWLQNSFPSLFPLLLLLSSLHLCVLLEKQGPFLTEIIEWSYANKKVISGCLITKLWLLGWLNKCLVWLTGCQPSSKNKDANNNQKEKTTQPKHRTNKLSLLRGRE